MLIVAGRSSSSATDSSDVVRASLELSDRAPGSDASLNSMSGMRSRCLVVILKIAGSMTSDTNRQAPTPIVSTAPRLCSPRCAAIIMLPKPTMVVSDVSMMALIVLGAVQ
jgi:hypothetical protein